MQFKDFRIWYLFLLDGHSQSQQAKSHIKTNVARHLVAYVCDGSPMGSYYIVACHLIWENFCFHVIWMLIWLINIFVLRFLRRITYAHDVTWVHLEIFYIWRLHLISFQLNQLIVNGFGLVSLLCQDHLTYLLHTRKIILAPGTKLSVDFFRQWLLTALTAMGNFKD